jgi:hypothetical protein
VIAVDPAAAIPANAAAVNAVVIQASAAAAT